MKITFQYKCKRCGGLIDGPIMDGGTIVDAKGLLLNPVVGTSIIPEAWPLHGKLLTQIICECRRSGGSIGIAELVGFTVGAEKAPEPEKPTGAMEALDNMAVEARRADYSEMSGRWSLEQSVRDLLNRRTEPPKDPACPKCRVARMTVMHDDTGMYCKCGDCGYEYPPKRVLK